MRRSASSESRSARELARPRCRARTATVTVGLEDGTSASGAELLVAVGRAPVTGGLGLETVGLEPGKPIEVGEDLRSPAHDWLYAVGDCNGRALLTHMGKYQGRIAADVILGKDARVGLRRAALPARDLHRPAGRGRRSHACLRAAGGAGGAGARRSDERECRLELRRPQRARHVAPRRRRARRDRGGHVHGLRGGGVPARGDDRGRRASSGSSNSSTPFPVFPPAASSG